MLINQPSIDSSGQVDKFLDGIEEVDENLPHQSLLKGEISYQQPTNMGKRNSMTYKGENTLTKK